MNGSQQTIEKNSDKKATDRGFTNPLFDAVVDKKPLFDVDMESSEEKSIQETDDDAVDATFVRQFFCAVWPYRLLKMLNWLILLIIFIGACLSYSFPYMNIAYYYRGQHIMFGLIWGAVSIPLLLNIVVNKQQRGANPGNGKCAVGNFWTAFLALMDLCLYGICITLLLVGSVRNGEQAFRVHQNYWPSKLAPATTTTTPPSPPPTYYWDKMSSKEPEPVLARLRVPYRRYGYGNTWNAGGWRAANEDFHLIADPLISLFCALATILNITLLLLAYKMMRRANIWRTPINNNEARQQCRSLFDIEYSRKLPFAVLNFVKWLVPFVMLIANVAITDSFWPHAVYAVTAIFLGHLMLWIFYFCKVHVRHQVKVKEESQPTVPQPRLFGVFVADVLFAVCAVILIKVHVQSDFMFWTYVCSLIFSSWLLFWRVLSNKNIRREFAKFSMELPQISIQLNVQINKGRNGGGKAVPKQVEQQPMGGNMEGNEKATEGREAAE